MRHPSTKQLALACGPTILFTAGAQAGEWPGGCEQSSLPSDDPNYPSDQLILTCLPSNFNGTLIIYAHGYVRPQEPLALPEEFGNADVQELVRQLVDLGFGVATSSFHKNGYAIEQAETDLNRLVDHVTSIGPDINAIYAVGASEGGLITAMLIEQHPEIYDGGLALCGPLAGTSYQIRYLADVRVLFDYFYPEVFPFGALNVPDDAHERWDGAVGFKAKIAAAIGEDPAGIAQVFDVAQVTCNAGDPAVATNCAENMLAYSVFGTNDLLATAGGWPVSNVNEAYSGSEDDAALNASVERFDADPAASTYADQYYRPSGLLERPLVTLHTTGDPGVPYRHELLYFNRAALSGRDQLLTVLPVEREGHCAFTPEEVLGGFGALLLKSDSDLTPLLVGPLEALYRSIDVGEGAGRLAELVQNQAGDFLDQLEGEFGFLEEARESAGDPVDAVEDFGGDGVEAVGDGAGEALIAAEDLGRDAKDELEDLF